MSIAMPLYITHIYYAHTSYSYLNLNLAGETFTPELRKKLMAEIDTDGSGDIDAEEFYKWMVVNAKSDGGSAEGSKQMQLRNERLEIGKDGIDDHLMELLEEVRLILHPNRSIVSSLTYLVYKYSFGSYIFCSLSLGLELLYRRLHILSTLPSVVHFMITLFHVTSSPR